MFLASGVGEFIPSLALSCCHNSELCSSLHDPHVVCYVETRVVLGATGPSCKWRWLDSW